MIFKKGEGKRTWWENEKGEQVNRDGSQIVSIEAEKPEIKNSNPNAPLKLNIPDGKNT